MFFGMPIAGQSASVAWPGLASGKMRSDDAHAQIPAVDQYQFAFFRLKIINKQGQRPEARIK
jgi:hypothetical protein